MQLNLKEMEAKIKELEGKAIKYTAQGELAQKIANQQEEDKGGIGNKIIQTSKGMDLR
ncbi:hypothetical protein [Helicobacter mesocricetorum]|uniref:hypothetical protein n=1 Tax=Helicobacter mesocricetorum TaxID=87012 RepID=UPI001315804F|nr:hypothetical protein [Helicobacter mesocricetorum]